MKLNQQGLEHKTQWQQAGFRLPQFDRRAVAAATKENPFWIHFGAGNIFRAFQANAVQNVDQTVSLFCNGKRGHLQGIFSENRF